MKCIDGNSSQLLPSLLFPGQEHHLPNLSIHLMWYGKHGGEPLPSKALKCAGGEGATYTYASTQGKMCQVFTHHCLWGSLVVEKVWEGGGEIVQGRAGLGPEQQVGRKRIRGMSSSCGPLKALPHCPQLPPVPLTD